MILQLDSATMTSAMTAVAILSVALTDDDAGPAALARLSAPEIKAMFSQRLTIREGEPGRFGPLVDQFTPQGIYVQSGRIVPLSGSYVIRGDLVCIEDGMHPAELCRAFYRSPDGELWESETSWGATRVVVLVRIQVESAPNR